MNQPNTVMLGESTTFVMGIMSTRTDEGAARRKLTRETYLQDSAYCPLKDLTGSRYATPSHCFVYYTFLVGGGDENAPFDAWDNVPITLPPMTEEEQNEGDITILNVKENTGYGKSRAWFKFVNVLLQGGFPIDYAAKVDEDAIIGTTHLTQLIKNDLPPAPYNKGIYAGRPWANFNNQVMYAKGGFYFMSSDVVWKLATMKRDQVQKKLNYSEKMPESQSIATLIGFPTNWMNLDQYKFWRWPVQDEKEWRELFAEGIDIEPEEHLLPFDEICPENGLVKKK